MKKVPISARQRNGFDEKKGKGKGGREKGKGKKGQEKWKRENEKKGKDAGESKPKRTLMCTVDLGRDNQKTCSLTYGGWCCCLSVYKGREKSEKKLTTGKDMNKSLKPDTSLKLEKTFFEVSEDQDHFQFLICLLRRALLFKGVLTL